jgi:hypothetical protein
MRVVGSGVAVTIASAVDSKVAKGHMHAGFQKQLSPTSLFLVYAAFAFGLALGAHFRTAMPPSPARTVAWGNRVA